jgi:hypothetical protein
MFPHYISFRYISQPEGRAEEEEEEEKERKSFKLIKT